MNIRFDDISRNTNMTVVDGMIEHVIRLNYTPMLCVSPLTHSSERTTGRVFPERIKPLSDHRSFYKVNSCMVSFQRDNCIIASHGLIHVDHRLLSYEAQEMSILVSCSLTNSLTFVPPFNKWNKDTEQICMDNNIELVKYEDGWRSMEYNKFDPSHNKWYFHPYLWTPESFKKWFET